MLRSFLAIKPLILTALAVFLPMPVLATKEEQITTEITSVSRLSDVEPTDWEVIALRSLIERYGCITGYSDNTYQGNVSFTRNEFASALNTCINALNQQLENQSQLTQAEIATIQRLQTEFTTELTIVQGRLTALEENTKNLQSQQFSPTMKLGGSFVAVVSGLTGDRADGNPDTEIDSNLAFNYRTRLNLTTSFSGRDRLLIRLQSSDRVPNFNGASATDMTRLSFEVGNTNDNLTVNLLEYRFPVGEKLNFYLFANATSHHYYTNVLNPYFASFGGAKGSPSRFLERNPIYRIGFISPAGVAAGYRFNPDTRLDVGFLAENSNNTNEGLFGGTYSALAQFTFKPAQNLDLSFTYLHHYSPDGNLLHRTGSNFANLPFGIGVPLTSNSYGVQALWRVTPKVAVSSCLGYMTANRVDGVGGNADIINYAVNLAFPDLFTKNAVGGIGLGMPPKTINNTVASRQDTGTGLHLEAFYQYPLTENITLIPGVIYLTNPNHNHLNKDIFVGTFRTVFNF